MVINGVSVQSQLESTINIKSINGSSILGSGDLVVGGSSGLLGVHAIIPLPSGGVASQAINGGSTSIYSQAFSLNNVYYTPFIPNQTIITSSLFIVVDTAEAGSLVKIGIYSNLINAANTLLFTSTDIDCSTTGLKTVTTTFTFVAGTIYWLAYTTNTSNMFITTLPIFSVMTSPGTYYYEYKSSALLQSNKYTNGLPTTSSGTSRYPINIPLIGIVKA